MIAQNPAYLLDANVFIEAAKRYYAFDIVPIFWEKLKDEALSGRILSIDRVKIELSRGKDQLAQWAESEFAKSFASTNEKDVDESYRLITRWVQAQSQFRDSAKAKFFGDPDGWLVAYAKAKGYVVVTHEVLNPDVKTRVPIPNVCQAFNVKYVDTFAMLRALKITLG